MRARPNGVAVRAPVPVLFMAVPKRLLKRAVDRNALRRVAREAWRQSHRDGAAPARPAWLLRLKVRPEGFSEISRPARKRFWRHELDALFGRLCRRGGSSA